MISFLISNILMAGLLLMIVRTYCIIIIDAYIAPYIHIIVSVPHIKGFSKLYVT